MFMYILVYSDCYNIFQIIIKWNKLYDNIVIL